MTVQARESSRLVEGAVQFGVSAGIAVAATALFIGGKLTVPLAASLGSALVSVNVNLIEKVQDLYRQCMRTLEAPPKEQDKTLVSPLTEELVSPAETEAEGETTTEEGGAPAPEAAVAAPASVPVVARDPVPEAAVAAPASVPVVARDPVPEAAVAVPASAAEEERASTPPLLQPVASVFLSGISRLKTVLSREGIVIDELLLDALKGVKIAAKSLNLVVLEPSDTLDTVWNEIVPIAQRLGISVSGIQKAIEKGWKTPKMYSESPCEALLQILVSDPALRQVALKKLDTSHSLGMAAAIGALASRVGSRTVVLEDLRSILENAHLSPFFKMQAAGKIGKSVGTLVSEAGTLNTQLRKFIKAGGGIPFSGASMLGEVALTSFAAEWGKFLGLEVVAYNEPVQEEAPAALVLRKDTGRRPVLMHMGERDLIAFVVTPKMGVAQTMLCYRKPYAELHDLPMFFSTFERDGTYVTLPMTQAQFLEYGAAAEVLVLGAHKAPAAGSSGAAAGDAV